MCLLIHQPAGVTLPEDALADFYSKNEDGFGAVINDGGKVEVIKMVGSLKQTIEMYNTMVAGKESVIHFRMRTHGEIDLDNCHPYTVIDKRLWLAHNGVLACSNPVDSKMSDTWHIIKYMIRPVAQSDFNMIFDPGWAKVVGNQIGGNKFALMDDTGRVVIINKSQGVEHFDCWLSNTYAWSPTKFGYKFPYSYPVTNYPVTNPQSKYYSGDLWSDTWYSKGNKVAALESAPAKQTKARKATAKTKKSVSGAKGLSKQVGSTDQKIISAFKKCLGDPEQMTEWVWRNKAISGEWVKEHYPNADEELADINPEAVAQMMEEWIFETVN